MLGAARRARYAKDGDWSAGSGARTPATSDVVP